MNGGIGWLALLVVAPLQAATVVDYRSSGDCPATAERLVASGPFLRMDLRTDGQAQSTLFDGTESLVTALMHDTRQFIQVEVDLDAIDYQSDVMASTGHFMDRQFEKIAEMQRQQCEQLKQQRIACPQLPDMKAMMAQMGALTGMATVESVDSGRDGEVAGTTCRWWQRRRGGVPERDTCHAAVAEAPFAEADRRGLVRGLKAMQRYAGTLSPLMQRFGAEASAGPPPGNELILAEICHAPSGDESGRVEATIRAMDVADAEFAVPVGYTRMSMQE